MPATTGYQAGVETAATQISYAVETAWGTAPAVQFQAIRYTAETLSFTKTRQRPGEIINTREAAQGVTTQQQAGGSINYAFSATTFDDFFSVVLQNDWGTTIALQSITTDMTITSGTNLLTSSLGTKYNAILQGTWIKLYGFTNPTNNNWFYVSVKTSGASLTLSGPATAGIVTESSSDSNHAVRSCNITNGTTFKSLFIQQLFSAALFLNYAGAYVSRMTLQGGIGNFLSGAIDIVAKSEASAVSNTSTGAVLAAPAGRVLDPIVGLQYILFNEAVFSSAVDQFSITMENVGAAPEYGMGSASAQGILGGTFQMSATFRAYFKDFVQYALFAAETSGRLSIILKDSAGYSYAIQIKNAILLVNISAGGPGQAVYATVNVEAGPASPSGTVSIDRLASS